MKQREHKNLNHDDLPLAAGLGVQPPPHLVEEWIADATPEVNVSLIHYLVLHQANHSWNSDCATFAALLQKETRGIVGIKWTGIVGTFCARHEVIRGTCNLHLGERYIHACLYPCCILIFHRFRQVDLAIAWALKNTEYEQLAFTYDIACQFKKRFYERFQLLPDELRRLIELPPADKILFALPVWHGNVHEEGCEAQNSCKCQPKMGKTDGEGPEHFWALFNAFAGLTREQGDGARFDEFEDIFDGLNFLKQNGLGPLFLSPCLYPCTDIIQAEILFRRLKIALIELDVQASAFEYINSSMPADTLEKWTAWIVDWEADRSLPNPYLMEGESMSLCFLNEHLY